MNISRCIISILFLCCLLSEKLHHGSVANFFVDSLGHFSFLAMTMNGSSFYIHAILVSIRVKSLPINRL